ncbi:MAG: ParB N-terminal domain-containing protein [Chloroflexi bacterium]|nr:ParB N-terminal domain-containing protein [Chloroflexota bacterium]
MIDIPIKNLKPAPWNSNVMDDRMIDRLKESIMRYGCLTNLVVRPLIDRDYEVIGGNWRLKVLSEMGIDTIPCAVVGIDDAQARLLSLALNRIEGEDDLGLKAEALKKVLEDISQEDVLELLPETAQSLQALASIGQVEMATYLQNWQQAQSARLHHAQFQLTKAQSEVVEEALKSVLPKIDKSEADSPNMRGTALYFICKSFIDKEVTHHG